MKLYPADIIPNGATFKEIDEFSGISANSIGERLLSLRVSGLVEQRESGQWVALSVISDGVFLTDSPFVHDLLSVDEITVF